MADVFAFQGDGTVQAITSEGKTAWTADVSMAYPVAPDFQGGLVGIDQSGYSGAIVKWDGMTGQRGPAYTPSGTLEYELGVHTDGTVFAMQRSPNAVIGVDPAMGTQKFSIPVTIPGQSTGPYFGGMIVGGDGYAYVPYSYRGYPIDCSDGVGLCEVYHLRLLRIASGGSHDDIPIADVDTLFSELPTLGVHLITNGDTGALLSWSAWNGDGGPVVGMAVTNGTSVSLINGSMAAGQASAVEPVLQAQDGSFVGTVWAGEDGDTRYMVAFDAAGSMRWSVPNEQPLIATADGGVIAQSGITYDQNGNATGQWGSMPTYSWKGAYRVGSTESVAPEWDPADIATTYAAAPGGNLTGNGFSLIHHTFGLVFCGTVIPNIHDGACNNVPNFFNIQDVVFAYLVGIKDSNYMQAMDFGGAHSDWAYNLKNKALLQYADAFAHLPAIMAKETPSEIHGGDTITRKFEHTVYVTGRWVLPYENPRGGLISPPNEWTPEHSGSDVNHSVSFVYYLPIMDNAQSALGCLAPEVQCTSVSPAYPPTPENVGQFYPQMKAIGHGIGAIAAHETAHQLFGMQNMDCVTCEAPDVYERAESSGDLRPWFYSDDAFLSPSQKAHIKWSSILTTALENYLLGRTR